MTALKNQPLQPPKITFKQLHQQSLQRSSPTNSARGNNSQILYSQTLLLDGCRPDSNPLNSESSISLQLPSSREITPSFNGVPTHRSQTNLTESPDSGLESSMDQESETWKIRENSMENFPKNSMQEVKTETLSGTFEMTGKSLDQEDEQVPGRPNDTPSPGQESDGIDPNSPMMVNNSYSMFVPRSPKRKLSSVGPDESPSPNSSKLDDGADTETGSLKDDVEMDGECSDMDMMYNSLEIDEEVDQEEVLALGSRIESKLGQETDEFIEEDDDDVIDDDDDDDVIDSPTSVLDLKGNYNNKSKGSLLNQGLLHNNNNNSNNANTKSINSNSTGTPRMTIPIKCSECNHSFHSNASYAIHQRKHTGERPFVCDECGLGFTQKGNLSRHKQTHQDNKPFKCDQCNYATKRKDALITHKSTHYLNKRYKCTYCSQAYKQRQSLRDHLRACHRVPNSELRDVLSESVTPMPVPMSLTQSPTPINTPSGVETGSYPSSDPSPIQGSENTQKFRLLDSIEQRRHQHLVDIKNNLQRLPPIDVGNRLAMGDRALSVNPMDTTLKRGGAPSMGAGGYQPISPPNVTTASNKLKDLLRTTNNNNINNSQYMDNQMKIKNGIMNQYNRSQQAAGMLRDSILNTSTSPHIPSSAAVSSLPRPLQQPQQLGDVERYLHGRSSGGYPTRPSQMYPLGPTGPSAMTPAVQQLNAIAAAYNLPYLRNAAQTIPTSVNSAATAIAYSQHQLEAAKRLQGIRAQLPPLIKPTDLSSASSRVRHLENPTETSKHLGPSPGNKPSPGISTQDCGHPVTDPENRRTLDSSSEETSSVCVSCQSALKCETCCIIFNDNVMYTIHLGLHSKMDPLKCNLCGFLANNRYEFASHIARGDHRQLNPTPKNSPVI